MLASILRMLYRKSVFKTKMKIFVLGVPVYCLDTRECVWATEFRHSVLWGIITLKTDSNGAQRLRLLGITVFSKRNKNGIQIWRVLSIPVWFKNVRRRMASCIVQNINEEFDDVYVIRHNIGETYIYLAHLKNWIRKNKSKKPVLIVRLKKDIPLYQMFLPNNVILKYMDNIQIEVLDVVTTYKGKRIFCPTPDILQNILKVRNNIPTWNFYNHICQDFALDVPDMLGKPRVSRQTKNSVKSKIDANFKRPFVIVMPNANSLETMPAEFWNEIIRKLNAGGYDVFVNNYRAINKNSDRLDLSSVITFDCDLAEIYELARQSAGVITLASGLAVFLTASNKKMDLIYTNYPQLSFSSKTVYDTYSVYCLPGIDKKNIQEYDSTQYSYQDLANVILSRYIKQ